MLVARDRTGAAIDVVLPRLDAISITAVLSPVITWLAELYCDGGKAITAFARRVRVALHVLPAPSGPNPEAAKLHISNVNALSRPAHGKWLGRFHGVGTKNLPSYLSWRRTIETFSTASTPEAWVMGTTGLGPHQQSSQ